MVRRRTDTPRGVLQTAAAGSERIAHDRFLPSDDLAPFVEHYWQVVWDLRGLPPQPVATLPHPSVLLVCEDGLPAVVAGPARARFARDLTGVGRVFSIKFRPGGFRPFAREPVSRLADTEVPVAAVFGPAGDELAAGLAAADRVEARVALAEDFLRGRRPPADPAADRAAELVYGVMREPGIVKVTDLVARSGLGLRSLQRLFAEYVGVGPKWVIQRYRLHEAAERLAAGPVDHSLLAHTLGYSDQAHFIRDFKAVVGLTPAAYARQAGSAAHEEDPQ